LLPRTTRDDAERESSTDEAYTVDLAVAGLQFLVVKPC
jgi:hypothetical protein